jgi:hypothetical protein
MKKMMLALVLTVVGLGLTTESIARCGKRGCNVECATKCEKPCKTSCEKACTTYSESGCPVCIKSYACERQFPANKHVHTTYSCPVDCQSMPEDYSCKTELIEVGN